MKKMFLTFVVFSFLLTACSSSNTETPSAVSYDDFAKCLGEKGAEMYGASWCPHCNNQKEMFGASFKYIKYFECAADDGGQAQVCKNEEIKGYPTWKFSNGEKIEGEAKLSDLSSKSGCSLDLIKA